MHREKRRFAAGGNGGNRRANLRSKSRVALRNPMPQTSDQPTVTRHIIVAIALLALAGIVWTAAEAVVIAFGGMVLASVLLSLSSPLSRATGLAPRWTLLIVIGGLLGCGTLLSWLFGNEVVQEFAQLQRQLPEAVRKVEEWLGNSPAGRTLVDSVRQSSSFTEALSRASSVAAGFAGVAANLLLIVFLGVYFAANPTLYRDGALRLVPPPRRPQVRRMLDDAGDALRKWLLAQAIAMAAVGILTGVVLAILGVPLALSLGVLAGLLEFVPVIGPIVAAVPGILLAFLKGPEMALYVALAYVVVQQIESNVITPLAQRWAVRLPPVVGLLAILVCGLLFGVIGIVFAMPIAVVTMVAVKHLYVEDTLENGGAKRPAARR